MNLANIGKTLANEALQSGKNMVMDAVREPAKSAPAPAAPADPNSVDTGAIILGQIQAMQRPLSAEQELMVLFRAGDEMIRVHEIIVPNTRVLVFSGYDAKGCVTRVISPVDAAQVVCKVIKVNAGAQPLRVNVLTPKPRPEPAA